MAPWLHLEAMEPMSHGQRSFSADFTEVTWDLYQRVIRLYGRSFDHGSYPYAAMQKVKNTSAEKIGDILEGIYVRACIDVHIHGGAYIYIYMFI